MRRRKAQLLANLSWLAALAVSAMAGDKQDPLDILIDRYYEARGRDGAANQKDIYDPAFLLNWRHMDEEKADSEDDFADWTIFGREPTRRDLQAIAENLRKLGRAGGEKSSGGAAEDGETGSVIINLVEAATSAVAVYGRYSVGYDAWPWSHDEDEISWFAPDGSLRWYSAPQPWVIHERQPFIGLWTPSPYYENPWILTMVEGPDGVPVHTWRNIWPRGGELPFDLAPASNTHLGFTYDSAAGWRGGIEFVRPWGGIVWQGGGRDAARASHDRQLQISLDFHGASRLPLATALGAGAGGLPTTVVRRSKGESITARGWLSAKSSSWHRIQAHPAPNYWLGNAVASGAIRTITSGDDLIFIDTGAHNVVIKGEQVIDLRQPPPPSDTMILRNTGSGNRLIYLPPDGGLPIVGRGIILLSR